MARSVVVAVLITWPALLAAQPSRCQGSSIGVVLGEDAIVSLTALRESRFTHAFLIDLVAREGAEAHPVVGHAQRYIARGSGPAPAGLAADSLLTALRCAREGEVRRARSGDALDRGRLATLLAPVPTDPRPSGVEAMAGRAGDLAALLSDLQLLGVAADASDAVRDAHGLAERAARASARVRAVRARPPCAGKTPAKKQACEQGRRQEAEGAYAAVADDDYNATLYQARGALGPLLEREGELSVGSAAPGEKAATARLASVLTVDVEPLEAGGAKRASAAGGSVPANLFIALTDYTVERIRDELVIGYLGTIERHIGSGWAQDLFPETTRLFGTLTGSPVTDFGLPTWRASLVTDIGRLPAHALGSQALADAVLGPADSLRTWTEGASGDARADLEARLAAHRTLRRVRVGVGLVEHVRQGGRPLDLLADLSIDVGAADDPVLGALARGAEVASRIAQDVRLQDVDLGGAGLPAYVLSARTLRQATSGHRSAYFRLLLGGAPSDGGAEAVARAVALTADFLDGAEALVSLPADTPRRARARALGEAVRLALDVPRVLASSFSAGHAAEVEALGATWGRVVELLTLVEEGNASTALARTLAFYREVAGRPLPLSREVLDVLSLSASLAEAESGEQMVQAFRAAALPAGSYRARREGRGARFAVNLYPGVVLGAERLEFSDGPEAWAWSGGASLPVGVNVALFRTGVLWADAPPLVRFVAPRLTVSAFASVVDLGALLSYRLSGTDGAEAAEGEDVEVGAVPSVSARDVFAPGGALVLGLGGSPLALTFGVQLLPELRSLRVDGVERSDATVLRASVGVALDLPLLNLSGR